MVEHLTETEFGDLVSGAPGERVGSAVRAHLDACPECRAGLETRRGDEALFEELAHAVREPAVETPLLAPGSIPGYELQGEVYRGGQGTVYLARQLATNRDVALKVLTRGREASSRDRSRFEREVELVCRLRHPHVVTVYESGETGGQLWYAMEYVDGRRLDDHLKAAQPDRAARLELFRRIAGAVVYAHRSGVIHRDLKPANILVDATGEPHVVDFGLALPSVRELDGEERLTVKGEFLGTLAYASPEQVTADPGIVDTRTDVHALGLLLYEMLTGRLPWDVTGNVTEVLQRVAHAEPADPCSLSSDVDDELRTILLTALEKDPGHRYASADALLRDVEHYIADEPLEARAPSTWYVLQKAVARHRTRVAVAVFGFVVVAVAATAVLRAHWRAERQSDQADFVRQLMRDLVGVSGPMGNDAARLAVLEDAAGRLAAGLEGAPDVEAALQLALGEAHAARLRNAEAEVHLRRALERFRSTGDDGLAGALELLAGVLSHRGDDEAVVLAEEALALREASLPAGDPRLDRTRRVLARALIERLPTDDAYLERAGEQLDTALESLRGSVGEDHPDVAATRVLRAALEPTREAAAEIYAAALPVLEKHPGEVRRTIECLDWYAGVLGSLGKLAEAEEMIDRSVVLTRQTYGEEHTVDLVRRRARIERQRGNTDSAERLSRIALATELEAWVARRPDEWSGLSRLAARLRDQDQPPPYPAVFAELRRLRGNGDFTLASWMNELASGLRDAERDAEAEALLREALNVHCRVYGADCGNRRTTLLSLARLLVDGARPERAIPHLEECLASFERSGGADGERAGEVRALLDEAREGPVR